MCQRQTDTHLLVGLLVDEQPQCDSAVGMETSSNGNNRDM